MSSTKSSEKVTTLRRVTGAFLRCTFLSSLPFRTSLRLGVPLLELLPPRNDGFESDFRDFCPRDPSRFALSSSLVRLLLLLLRLLCDEDTGHCFLCAPPSASGCDDGTRFCRGALALEESSHLPLRDDRFHSS
jgi:hypothetical protein